MKPTADLALIDLQRKSLQLAAHVEWLCERKAEVAA